MSQTVRTNRATNPGAASTTGWAAIAGTGGTAAIANRSTGGAAYGTLYNRVTWTAATTSPSGGISYTCTGLAAATQYATQMWVRSSKAQGLVLTVTFQTSAPATVNTVQTARVDVQANTWTQISVVGTSGAGVTQAVIDVQAPVSAANWANGDTLDGDAVLVEAAATVGNYFDGGTVNAGSVMYAWTGTANASTSTATTYVPAIALAPGATPCPNVAVTLTDLTPTDNTVNLWRTADGVRTAVRGTRGLTVNGSTALTDYEVPLGRTVSYDLEVTAGVTKGASTPTSSITVTSPSDSTGKPTWWIQDPLVPGTAIALSVAKGDSTRPYLTAAAVKSLEYASDVAVIPVVGSAYPVAIGGQRMAAAGVDFSMFTNAATAATNLRNLLQGTAVLLLRPPGTGKEPVPALVYTAAAKPVEQPVTVAYGGTLTKWSITGQTVAAPTAGILVPIWTYGKVAVLWSTYQQAQTTLAAKTYLDVLKSPTGA